MYRQSINHVPRKIQRWGRREGWRKVELRQERLELGGGGGKTGQERGGIGAGNAAGEGGSSDNGVCQILSPLALLPLSLLKLALANALL